MESVKPYGYPVMVVNDGATDNSAEILSSIEDIHIIGYEENRGKGYALNYGMQHAYEAGFTHVLTLDSDGQHFAEDIPNLIAASQKQPEALVVGTRDFNAEGVPAKNSFGNKFSNFWYLVATGIRFRDTQSGFRVYPIHCLKRPFITWKGYEGELEVLVKSVWRGHDVVGVPIRVYYAPKEVRVSHFRPFRDVMRISALNWTLIPQALFYYRPLLAKGRIKKKGLRRFAKEDLLGSNESDHRLAAAIGLGAAMSVSPFWGWQGVLTLVFAQVLRLNKLLAFTVSNFSLPPLIPFILWGSYALGAAVLGREILFTTKTISFEAVWQSLWLYLVGSLLLAVIIGFTSWAVSWGVLRVVRGKRRG